MISLERTDPPEGVLTFDALDESHGEHEAVPFEGWLGLMSALEHTLSMLKEPVADR